MSTLTSPATDAQMTVLAHRFRTDGGPEYDRRLRAALAHLDARPSIAQETADELGIDLPDCAKGMAA